MIVINSYLEIVNKIEKIWNLAIDENKDFYSKTVNEQIEMIYICLVRILLNLVTFNRKSVDPVLLAFIGNKIQSKLFPLGRYIIRRL